MTMFFVLSIFLHLLFFTSLRFAPSEWLKSYEVANTPVEIEIIETVEVAKSEIPATQIVDQSEKENQEPENKNAKYLSAQNQSVLKETVAQNRGEFKNVRSQGSSGNAQSQEQQNDAEKPTPDKTNSEEKSRLAESDDKIDPRLPRDKDALFKDITKKYNSRRMFENVEKKSTAQVSPGSPGEASQTSDYLKGKDPGLETLLNTREYKYYTYFNRIRRRLSEHWEPKVKEKMSKMFKQGRTIASTDDKVTKLLIVLNDSGVLVKVQVLSDSGVRDLDEAAIEAFRAAAPFPHPPEGIIDEEGTIKIRWDFVLES